MTDTKSMEERKKEMEALLKKKVAEEEAEKREKLNSRMDNGDIQLSLFDIVPPQANTPQPFFSQGMVEKDTVWLPNASKAKSIEVFRNNDQRITIGKAGGRQEWGTLKIRHKDVLYAVLAIWSNHGYPCTKIKGDPSTRYGVVRTTRYQILSMLHDKNPGKALYEGLADTLHGLKSIPVEVFNAGKDAVSSVFSLFSKYDIKADEKGNEIVEILLNEALTARYYEKVDVKLLWFDVYTSMRTDLAKIIYPILDRHLTVPNGSGTWHKTVKDLCSENGLALYKKNADQKRYWRRALEELNSITLTNGKKVSVELIENRFKALVLEARVIH